MALDGLIAHDKTPFMRFTLTRKGRSLVIPKKMASTEEPTSGFCEACECSPCDCGWGN